MKVEQEGIPISARELLESEVAQTIRKATVPIYTTRNDGELRFDRTAVFLRVDSDYFLLTAMHFIADWQGRGVRIFTQSEEGTSPVELSSGRIVGAPEPVDIAVVSVQPLAVRQTGAVHRSLKLKDLDLSPDWDATTPFILCGYPQVWESQTPSAAGPLLVPRPFTYLATGYDGPIKNPAAFSRDVHLAIPWVKQFECIRIDNEIVQRPSALVDSPKPYGMSGGGIWRSGIKPHDGVESGAIQYACKLSAIQHSVNWIGEYALGTRVSMAIYLIWRDWPQLRPAIEHAFPNTFPIISSW